MIKAVIFDMDGVLIDSEPLWFKAERSIYKKLGFNLTQELYDQTIGVRYDQAVQGWYEKFSWEGPSVKRVQKIILNKVKEIIKEDGVAMEGVISVLSFLKDQNVKLALASSSPQSLIDLIINQLDIKKYFDFVLSGEFEEHPKPAPDIFLKATKKLQAHPDSCLVVEDSTFGLMAAKEANMKCIAIVKDKSKTTKQKYIADYYMTSLREFDQDFWKKINN